jgi:hypothetical protein
MMRTCTECEADYDPFSVEKRRAGGKITVCPECAYDPVVKYVGVSAGEGKMGTVQVLKFNSNKDREAYMKFWKASSGMNTGKNCQMQFRAAEPNIKFMTVATFSGNINHKGKA